MKTTLTIALLVVVCLSLLAAVGSRQDFTLGTTPGNPTSGKIRLWADSSSGKLRCADNSGTSCYTGDLAAPVTITSGYPNDTYQQIQDNPLASNATTITVTSTTGFPGSGTLWIRDLANSEAVTYTGTTSTTFTGVTRGLYGTTANSHAQNLYIVPIEFISAPCTTCTPTITAFRWGFTANSSTVVMGTIADASSNTLVSADSTPTFNAGPGGKFLSSIYTSSGGSASTIYTSGANDTYFRAAVAIHIGDDQAQAIDINNGGGVTTVGGQLKYKTLAFASLGTVPAAGTAVYCTNCTTAATCASGGSGHMAVSNGTNWTCN